MSNTSSDAQLLSSIISYLSQLKQTNPAVLSDPDSLDVAIQCLTEAINKQNTQNNTNTSSYSLKQIYEAGIAALSSSTTSKTSTPAPTKEVSASDKAAAEKLKNEGNTYLTQQRYDEAADKYTAAIKYNPNNAIYYANSRTSISLDPNYAKGHYRLGQALYQMNRFHDCIPHYERALTLTRTDPGMSETIQQQLTLVRERLQEEGEGADGDDGAGAGGGMDFNAILNNPMFANLASQLGGAAGGEGGLDFNALLSNPAIQQMAANMFGGGGGGGAGAGGAAARQTPAAAKPAVSPTSSVSSASSSSSSTTTPQPSSSASSSSSSSSNPLAAFLASPAGQQLASDPELQPVIADVQTNGPNAVTKYLGNPSIMNKLSSIMGPLMSNMKKK